MGRPGATGNVSESDGNEAGGYPGNLKLIGQTIKTG